MYRQGLGDCFLISLLRGAERPFHLMIDCGVILGTPDATTRLRAAIEDIIATTGGHVDVLAVTHEHYDHVAGFNLVQDLFAGPEQAGAAGKLSVGEVWVAWTEDPADDLANQLRSQREGHVKALAAISNRMRLSGAAVPEESGIGLALRFFGVADGQGLGATAQAMQNAKDLAPANGVAYRHPGEVFTPGNAPELRVYVLGPPHDRAALMKTDATSGVYHLDAEDLVGSVRLAAGLQSDPDTDADAASAVEDNPFDRAWSYSLSGLEAGATPDTPLAGFLRARYFGPATPSPEADVSWRRVDGAWLANAEQLALALDSATNNTSLALAIEVVGSDKVLLFPADAQVGNWLSWQGLHFDVGGQTVTTPDLLGRTVFYKVGHHGSHNATLKDQGLELMPKNDLVAFIPVDQAMAQKKGWGRMPLDAIVAALRERCGENLARIDTELPHALPAISAGGAGSAYGSLYFDWTMAL